MIFENPVEILRVWSSGMTSASQAESASPILATRINTIKFFTRF